MPYPKPWWKVEAIKRAKRLFDENEALKRNLQSARDKVDFVSIVPVEVTEAIFSYLSVQELISCSTVSISWHEVTNSSLLWRAIAEDTQYQRTGVKQLLDKDQLTSVDSNFLNELRRFRVPSREVRLSPMNDWKRFHCQYNFLFYNWERGFCAAHVITTYNNPLLRIISCLRVTFPSKLPKDRLFLPYQYKFETGPSAFYLLRLDGEPKIACEVDLNLVLIACVNRDCLVFVHNKKVETVSLREDPPLFKIKTVGELYTDSDFYILEEVNNGDNYFLTMDNDVIVACYKYTFIKIWCKTTHNLKKTFDLPYQGHCFTYCHFHDSILYFSTWCADLQQAELKIWYMKDDVTKKIPMKREVKKICSNERYFLSVTWLSVNSNVIEVREHDDYNMVTMTVEQDTSENWGIPVPVVLLCEERVLYLEATTIKVMSLTLRTVFDAFSARSVVEIEKIAGHVLMVRLRNKIEVWDWKKGIRLYTPMLQCPIGHNVYCDDTRMVVVSQANEIKVIGFW